MTENTTLSHCIGQYVENGVVALKDEVMADNPTFQACDACQVVERHNMQVLAVDPGPTESAYVLWDGQKLHGFGKQSNDFFLRDGFVGSFSSSTVLVIERVACYGMPVGREVFDTVFFSGQLAQLFRHHAVNRLERKEVKMSLCGTMRAKDSNIIQALKDRFGDKGTKSHPGFFYGFHKDIWQAFALAVAWIDMLEPHETL